MFRSSRRRSRICATLAFAFLATIVTGCNGDSDRPPLPVRSDDPAVVATREALDRMRVAEARALVAEVAAAAGPEAPLLAARLAALEGDLFEAVRLLRAAGSGAPFDPGPPATLIEIYAWSGRLDEARDELEAAQAVHGRAAELVRAQGVIGLCTPGGAQSGLQLLLEAERLDATLPFLDRAIGEGQLLAANAAFAQARVVDAAQAARLALERLPGDERAREILADALASGADLDAAVELYEGLLADGAPVDQKLLNTLHNCATASMLAALSQPADERGVIDDLRERRYLRMLELGAGRADLGYGATFLSERAETRATAALDLLESVDALERLRSQGRGASDLEARLVESRARVHTLLDEALAVDPQSVMARGVLGEVYFGEQRFEEAAVLFEGICNDSAGHLDQLPLPVHLNAARAWMRAGREQRARDVLQAYLLDNPSGQWVDSTQEMLEKL